MVAATLALDVQQPTVGFFLAIKDKGSGEISRHSKEEESEGAEPSRNKMMSRL